MRIEYVKTKVTVDVVRITTIDERWYHIPLADKNYPSSTWISSYTKQGIGLMKFYAAKGWSEAEIIREQAGNKGSKVHQAIHDYVQGKTIPIDAKYINNITRQPEELTVEEYDAVVSFHEWFIEARPKVLGTEMVVLNTDVGYAGTLDLIVDLGGQKIVVDLKTSPNIYQQHELQLSSYKHALDNPDQYKMAILQIGYGGNKRGWKLTEIDDQFPLFLAAKMFWFAENGKKAPHQKDYPISVARPPDAVAVLSEKPEGQPEPPDRPPDAEAVLSEKPIVVEGKGGAGGESGTVGPVEAPGTRVTPIIPITQPAGELFDGSHHDDQPSGPTRPKKRKGRA